MWYPIAIAFVGLFSIIPSGWFNISTSASCFTLNVIYADAVVSLATPLYAFPLYTAVPSFPSFLVQFSSSTNVYLFVS